MRPCPYSTMPLPALSTNEPRTKHASRGFALRPLQNTDAGAGRHGRTIMRCGFIAPSALFLLHFLHYFSRLRFRHMKSAKALALARGSSGKTRT